MEDQSLCNKKRAEIMRCYRAINILDQIIKNDLEKLNPYFGGKEHGASNHNLFDMPEVSEKLSSSIKIAKRQLMEAAILISRYRELLEGDEKMTRNLPDKEQ